MRIDANKCDFRNWRVWHAEKCMLMRNVVWADSYTAQYCEAASFVNGAPIFQVRQTKKIVVRFDLRLVIINPVDDQEQLVLITELEAT